jgi:hypothetical protein
MQAISAEKTMENFLIFLRQIIKIINSVGCEKVSKVSGSHKSTTPDFPIS